MLMLSGSREICTGRHFAHNGADCQFFPLQLPLCPSFPLAEVVGTGLSGIWLKGTGVGDQFKLGSQGDFISLYAVLGHFCVQINHGWLPL